jgi:hypothetical protein
MEEDKVSLNLPRMSKALACFKSLVRPVLVLAVFAGNLPTTAQAQSESPECLEEVFAVNQEMQQNYGLNVLQPSYAIDDDSLNPFKGSYSRSFTMVTLYNTQDTYAQKSTSKAEGFMNSTGVQLRLATRIMNACPSTSKVSFGFARSGYWIPYFRMPSGKIRQGIALDCGRGNGDTLQWGYFYSC